MRKRVRGKEREAVKTMNFELNVFDVNGESVDAAIVVLFACHFIKCLIGIIRRNFGVYFAVYAPLNNFRIHLLFSNSHSLPHENEQTNKKQKTITTQESSNFFHNSPPTRSPLHFRNFVCASKIGWKCTFSNGANGKGKESLNCNVHYTYLA